MREEVEDDGREGARKERERGEEEVVRGDAGEGLPRLLQDLRERDVEHHSYATRMSTGGKKKIKKIVV